MLTCSARVLLLLLEGICDIAARSLAAYDTSQLTKTQDCKSTPHQPVAIWEVPRYSFRNDKDEQYREVLIRA